MTKAPLSSRCTLQACTFSNEAMNVYIQMTSMDVCILN